MTKKVNAQLDSLNAVFDEHPAMDQDSAHFTGTQRPGGILRFPSHRSGFAERRDIEEEEDVEDLSEVDSSKGPDSPWAPPSWRPPENSSAWYRNLQYLQESPMPRSSGRGSASVPDGDSASARRSPSVGEDMTTGAANIPLPRGSESPLKGSSPEPEHAGPSSPGTRQGSPEKNGTAEGASSGEEAEGEEAAGANFANYIRFSLRADVQQRTEPLENAIQWLQNTWTRATASRKRMVVSALGFVLFSSFMNALFSTPNTGPRPDLIQVAGFARSFEPLIHYSEHGVRQLSNLQETGTAVWDLSESVRIANLTSSPIIVKELDSLYDSLTGLATELTSFFAVVDGDFDNVLLVMDWARRELSHLEGMPNGPLAMVTGNLHSGLAMVGLLSASNHNDVRNTVFTSVFGVPAPQRVQMTLQRTFIELLSTLESSIESELKHAQKLFSFYAAIDQQFQNLHRATVRETDQQEQLESDVLSSLWQRALGARASQLRKFEKNKALLQAVRARTVANKNMLLDHNGKLVALKQSLEQLRRKLMGPLLRVNDGATTIGGRGFADQVRELEDTEVYLKKVRAKQKSKVMEELYHAKKPEPLEISDGL